MFICEFWEIFKKTFFAEHLRVTVSDIRMIQAVVIYNLTSFHAGACFNVPELLRRFAFWWGYFQPCFARPLRKRNNKKV